MEKPTFQNKLKEHYGGWKHDEIGFGSISTLSRLLANKHGGLLHVVSIIVTLSVQLENKSLKPATEHNNLKFIGKAGKLSNPGVAIKIIKRVRMWELANRMDLHNNRRPKQLTLKLLNLVNPTRGWKSTLRKVLITQNV